MSPTFSNHHKSNFGTNGTPYCSVMVQMMMMMRTQCQVLALHLWGGVSTVTVRWHVCLLAATQPGLWLLLLQLDLHWLPLSSFVAGITERLWGEPALTPSLVHTAFPPQPEHTWFLLRPHLHQKYVLFFLRCTQNGSLAAMFPFSSPSTLL